MFLISLRKLLKNMNKYLKKVSLTKISKELSKHLIHEHILPVKQYMQLFDSTLSTNFTKDNVTYVISHLLNVAVITKEENTILNKHYKDSMPTSFYITGNVLDRYSECGILLKHALWDTGAKNMIKILDINLDENPFENNLSHVMDIPESTVSTIVDLFKSMQL